MRSRGLVFRLVPVILTVVSFASAGIVEDVRGALARNSFPTADSELKAYRAGNGVTAEYIEAYSWMARAALRSGAYDQAAAYAKETKGLALDQLKKLSLDAEPHLPIALGAAIEVQAQTLAARGQRTQAVAVLQAALRTDVYKRQTGPRVLIDVATYGGNGSNRPQAIEDLE